MSREDAIRSPLPLAVRSALEAGAEQLRSPGMAQHRRAARRRLMEALDAPAMPTALELVSRWRAEWEAATGWYWGDGIAWGNALEVAKAIDKAQAGLDPAS